MKKVLFSATVVKTHINTFHVPYLKWFKDHGFETHVIATNDYANKNDCTIDYCDCFHDVKMNRNPFSMINIQAYKQIKKIINDNDFDIIHTHTPVGSVLTRLGAIQARRKGTSVIYTAHGFHFFKGASIFNWLIYFPVEYIMSKFTDILITINQEDYNIAKKYFKKTDVRFVHGVGFKQKTIPNPVDLKKQLNIENSKIMISVGELIKRKNHKYIIDLLDDEKIKNLDFKYLIVGDGKLKEEYEQYIKQKNLEDKVKLLGFRKDVLNLLNMSDLFIFPSTQEGMPLALLEAMGQGLPCVVSNIRGNSDLIKNNYGGFVCDSRQDYVNAIYTCLTEDTNNMRNINLEESKKYLLENVVKEYERIYLEIINQ